MQVYKKVFIFLIFAIAVGAVAYQFGKQKGISLNTNSKPIQQEEGVFNCPYSTKGGIYTEYATLANEVMVAGKPQLIENPEVVKMSEPFNLAEFEKDLYKLSTDKGWDERKFDVDDDGKEERILSANVAMNHTPHIALILKDNRVIFRAEGANIWIEDDYEGRGFTLHKTIDWNIGESETVRYLPKDGGFIPVWKQKACWVHFE